MRSAQSVFRRLVTVMSALAVTALGATSAAQTPAAAPVAPAAQANTVCGAQPFCYETADFAATITDFRTSSQGYYKIIDATIRFINKTGNPLGLGYATGSGIATDDRGNRYIVGGANGLRGMGLVYGPGNFDPKFEMQPGGFGDTRFELLLQGGAQQIIGFTFELDLTVNEIASYQGNQHSLGAEVPLQFKGLQNNVSAPAPGQVAYASSGQLTSAGTPAPCPTGGTLGTVASLAGATNSGTVQNATTGATTVASNASAAVASIGTLFGRKKPATAAANTAAPAPCTTTTATTAPVIAAPVANTMGPGTTAAAAPAKTAVAAPRPPTAGTVAPVVNAPAAKAPATAAKAPVTPVKAPVKPVVPVTTPAKAPATAVTPTPAKP